MPAPSQICKSVFEQRVNIQFCIPHESLTIRKQSRWASCGSVPGHVRLSGFQADFAFLLGASFADPDHAAALEDGRIFIEDNMNRSLLDTTKWCI
ncbi:MAG: hypothetical protein AUH16_01245 [Acidobacteria bacterium 13_2_20CM_57_7]|nr:MAG: hypothetical protein AUH16_01245 [Acidobacteria bacterium 13_2_20CM_57_7]